MCDNEWHDDEGIDKSCEREMERMWVEQIGRETHVKETVLMDLVIADIEWVEDRGDGALLDREEGCNRVVEEDIRVARTKVEILSNFTSRFCLTAKPN